MGGAFEIRLMGDPVLRQRAAEITEIDGRVARMVDDMLPAMYGAEGIGLAAPQVGIQRRLFVFDLYDGDGPQTLINPTIIESDGEWTYTEGCLSVPGLTFDIVRPKEVHIVGRDLDGNEVSIEADELLARLFHLRVRRWASGPGGASCRTHMVGADVVVEFGESDSDEFFG